VYIPWSQEEEDKLKKLKEKEILIEDTQFGRHNKVLENHQVANVHNMDDCGTERLEMEM
jgi:uncharacterized protein YheU (UPF0270 family)